MRTQVRTPRSAAASLVLLLALDGAPARAQAKAAASPGPAGKYALLIGIDTYEPPGAAVHVPRDAPPKGRFAAGLTFPNLKGPANDVAAMRGLLTSARFGFPQQNVHVLLDSAATHDGILSALHKDLVDDRRSGDTMVLYLSSHGSLRVNSKSDGQAYDLDGTGLNPTPLDGTIVPADAYLGAEDILSSELRAIFNQSADRGVHLTVIIDACHSGGIARGATDKARVPRNVEYDPRDLAQEPDKSVAPEARAINPVLVLTAAQKDQSAIDVQDAAPPHGLFTQSLVQALQELPPDAPAIDLFRRVGEEMEIGGAEDQQPALDTTSDRKRRPLFGGETAKQPLRATVIGVEKDGLVLDVGPASDIGPGSELSALNETNGVRTVLRIEGPIGMVRSRAIVVSPPNAVVRPLDVFEINLTKWVPAPRPELKFYAGPANLTAAQIAAAANALHDAGVALVDDPSSDAWTHTVAWDGAQWVLSGRRPATGKPASSADKPSPAARIGPTLTAAGFQKAMAALLASGPGRGKRPGSVTLWFNPPLPSEIAVGLLTDKTSAAQLTQNKQEAAYVVAGVRNATGLAYAWYQRGALEADVQTPPGYGRGCSPNSPYPLRTDWVPLDGEGPASKLSGSAVKLAKLNGWLKLQSFVTGSEPFPYTLGLERVDNQSPAEDGAATYKDERFRLTLNGSVDAVTLPRWVYVLGIDCQGTGALLWPSQGPGGRFPTENGRLASIPLPGSTFRITPPFGTDTYLLLTTSTPLPDPEVLNFEGVVRGGSAPASSPLQDLLRSTSAATRGAQVEAPTDWGLQILQMHSQPTPPPASPPAEAGSRP